MKKLTAYILAFIMIFAYAAAGSAENIDAQANSNILVAYFSATENTAGIAKHIQNILGADIYEIEPAVPYTAADLNYNSDCRANREQNDPSARPQITGSVEDMDKYDVIFLGYPIWWGQAPKIIYTFLESYDFSGKKIIPFCTSGSSGIGSSATNLHSLVNGAEWDSGRRFSGGSSQSTVKSWVDTITLPSPAPTLTPTPTPTPTPTETPVITISDTVVKVENAPENATLIMAFYKNSRLRDTIMKNVSGASVENIPAKNADTLKVFLWDMETLKPLCNAEEKPIESTIDDNLILINGGAFTMGSPTDEYERDNDEVQHEAIVSDFYMSPTEVSQKEYLELMGNNPSENSGENSPVENVTWYDVVNYCNALSRANGLDEVYTVDGDTVTWNKGANGYRLPTEAEWEYAARANTETPFNFGDYVHNSDANCYNAYGYNNDASGNWVNGSDSYLRRTVEVTRYNANDYGLYNMHGNVAEWVWDWYSAYDTEVTDNPTGKGSGNAKVIRGGGWNDHPKHIRSAYRGAHPADVPLYSIGFRVARSAETGVGSLTSTFTKAEEQENKNVLIAYFSQTGNTEGLTDIIAEMTGADVFHIERKTPYASSSNGPVLYGEALNELREYAVPDLKTSLEEAGYNIDDYDTILLGYCNWWSSIPASVRSFLIKYDMSGKTIIPYCSMGGGRFGQTISAVAKLNPNSNIKGGLDVSYSSYNRERIEKWLTDNGVDIK